MTASKGKTEAQVVQDIMAALVPHQNQLAFWKQHTGGALPLGDVKNFLEKELGKEKGLQFFGRMKKACGVMKFGKVGAADITGLCKPHGRRIEIEVKKEFGGRQSEGQKIHESLINECNGVYVLAHSSEQALEWLADEGIISL